MLTLLTGGARSGKSSAAVELARRAGGDVAFIATAEANDEEMATRIERHRADRPESWTTIGAPRELTDALASVEPSSVVVIDCLGLWVTNLLDLDDDEVLARADAVAELAARRNGVVLVVTNEVGSGIVPENALARRFRDLLGTVNQRFAGVADHSLFCAAGGVLPLRPFEHIAAGVLHD